MISNIYYEYTHDYVKNCKIIIVILMQSLSFVGIKLRKVEKIEQKEVERVNALNDVASILARRVAVEFSDSDSASESECDSEGWGEQESNLA